MKNHKKLAALLLALVMVLSILPMNVFAAEADASTEIVPADNQFVVMSTTDVHGKVWDYDFLSQSSVKNSLLNASTAVKQTREDYGDRTVLVDNGDLFQGTPVSSYNIKRLTEGTDTKPNPMAMALKYMDYDGLMMGNHEFNYAWRTMDSIYNYMMDETKMNAVPVICTNMYWEATGERVFKPYILKTFKVAGEDFTVMVIGIDNTDCTRWDIPDNYPGMLFSHPDNPTRDMAWEVNHLLDEVKDVQRDFTIVSYHSGLGPEVDAEVLVVGENTEGQILRVIHQTEGIDMVIAGHDHSTAYSGNKYKNKAGEDVLVVNAGGTTLTKTVFEANKVGDSWEVKQLTGDKDHNLNLGDYAVDEELKTMIQPYADDAEEYVNTVVGTLAGTWDDVQGSNVLYLNESDTMDLIGRTQIQEGGIELAKKYATVDDLNAKLKTIYGDDTVKQYHGDKVEVDFSSTSVVVNGSGHCQTGDVSIKTIYTYYRYDNSLYLIAVTGQEIKDMLEYNASERIDAKVAGGELKTQTKGESFTHPVFYGLNFSYDMYQPEGSRAIIGDFANGKKFDLNETYIFAINNYHLGNAGNETLARYDTTQQLWSQTDDMGGGTVQDLMSRYIERLTERDGGVYSNSAAKDGVNGNGEPISHWGITYSGDMTTVALPDTAAVVGAEVAEIAADVPVLIYSDSDGMAMSANPNGVKMSVEEATRIGNRLYAPETTAVITPVKAEGGWYLKVGDGYLSYPSGGNGLSVEAAPSDLSLWDIKAVDGGFEFHCVNASYNGNGQALEIYSGKYTTYGYGTGGPAFVFKLYSVATTGTLLPELKDGDKVAIVNVAGGLAVAAPSGNKMGNAAAYVTATETGSIAELAAEVPVFEVKFADDKTFTLKAESGYLTYGETGNSLTLAAEATNLSIFDLEPVEGHPGVYNVHCTNAAYNGKANQYLEFYSGNFTSYGFNGGGDAYEYSFYKVTVEGTNAAEEPKNDVPEAPIEGYVVNVFETSDVHGSLIDTSSGNAETYQYRLAYIADKVNDVRSELGDNILLLDGGDIYQANVVSNLQNGKPMMAAYDLMGYDAVALGNHEFDWGVETVIDPDGTIGSYTVGEYTGDSKIPVLTSNLTKNGEAVSIAQPYIILDKTAIDKDGKTINVKIGVIGFADDYSKDIMAAKFSEVGYVIKEDAAAVEALAVKLENELGCDAVVLLGHADGASLAGMLSEGTVIDLVLGGHSHSGKTGVSKGVTYMQPKNAAAQYMSALLVFQADASGKVTGVSVQKNTINSVDEDKTKLYKTDANVGTELDPDLVKLSDVAVANVADALNTVLGHVDASILKSGIGQNDRSSTAGNWMSALMAQAVGAQVGFTNAGGIRTELVLPEGAATRNITVGDVYTIAPFGNLIYAYEVTYPELLEVLNYSINGGSGLGLRMSGIDCYYENGAVTALVLPDGTLVYKDGKWASGYETKTIKIATNEYVATSDTPFKAWNSTDKLYSNTLADNESMIEILTAQGEANGGKLALNTDPHMIAGAYTGAATLEPAPQTPAKPDTPPAPPAPAEDDVPPTGDVSMVIWMAMAALSASGIVVLKRKEED